MSVNPRRPRPTILSIQYLRAIAAIAVVVFHILQWHGSIFRLGEHGVDIFFVISGFIMLALTDARPVNPGSFMLDRITRIAPPYWLATLATFLLVRLGSHIYHQSTDLTLLAKSLFFIPAFDDDGAVQPTLYLGWTLNFEMFFYIIFAFILFFKRHRAALLTAVLVALVCAGAIFAPQSAFGKVYTSPLLLEFLAGALLAKVFGPSLDRSTIGSQAAWAMLIVVPLALLSLYFSQLIFGALSVLLVAGGLLLERRGRMPEMRWLKTLGDASFAIYLFQQLVFNTVEFALNRTFRATLHREPPHSIINALDIVAAIGVGVLIYRYVERPLTRGTRSVLQRITGRPIRISSSPAG